MNNPFSFPKYNLKFSRTSFILRSVHLGCEIMSYHQNEMFKVFF
ncbi:hypothetical protein HOLDEFILI_00650 [Holdemania filiformis DSM 12042]|uniref:Uncharacterized protein n=1 Tax=Holdemania filiformis DSM 12042 TaxID=545696 RepID=B9Y4B9_9FIRM|nr:hypothetical protein HOLDEFILI_00650 [Holdemania filiformis DSM 12042]